MNELEFAQVPILAIDKSPEVKQTNIELYDLLDFVAITLKVQTSWIVGNGRQDYLVDARQLFCFFASKLTDFKHKEIARIINRNRTTVIHSIEQVERLLDAKDDLMVEKYLLIKKALSL